MGYYNHGHNHYTLERDDDEIRFRSSDEKVVDAVYEYIERYIQSENYRRLLLKLDAKESGISFRMV